MSLVLLNRAKMTVSGTPGTGTITLNAAATGFQTFAAAGIHDGALIPYLIEDGSAYEFGMGTYTSSGTTLARTTILGSSSSGSAISVTSAATVACVPLAEVTNQRGIILNNNTALYVANAIYAGSAASYKLSVNTLHFVPIIIDRKQTFTRIGLDCPSYSANDTHRLGIYRDANVGGKPGTLVVDAGTVTITGPGAFEITISTALDPGVYWLASVTSTDNSFVSSVPNTPFNGVMGLRYSSGILPVRGWTRAFTYGSLPSDESGQSHSYPTNNSSGPILWVRAV